MQIMYGMRGERHLPECELPWLRGYASSGPVRIGNAASEQLQLDVYGEIADAISTMRRAKLHVNPRLLQLQEELTGFVAKICHQPSSGIWEQRGSKRQFTYAKMMAWLALNLGVESVRRREILGPVYRWRRIRNRLHQEICRRGFDSSLGSFVQSYGSKTLDASSLLIPICGFLPFDDERVRGTISAIEQHLMRDGFVYRVKPRSKPEREASFLPCSFWYVQSLAMMGRNSLAKTCYERLLKVRNDVGLLSEEYDPIAKQLLGNFPQALSHIALVNAARALDANDREIR
jgi:GH15 family glucan-1,4-alpha-glucosidase